MDVTADSLGQGPAADGLTLSNDVINVVVPSRGAISINFNDTTLAADTQLHFVPTPPNDEPSYLSLTGRDVNNGLIINNDAAFFFIEVNSTSSEAGSFLNYGTVDASATVYTGSNAATVNYGVMQVLGESTPYTRAMYFDGAGAVTNEGLLLAGAGASVKIENTGAFLNGGTIEDRGNVLVTVAVTQTSTGVTNIDSGTLAVANAFNGGTVNVSAGSLEFSSSSQQFTAALDFAGPTGTLAFDGYTNLSAALQGNELVVSGTGTGQSGSVQQIADIQLVGTYSADEFQVSGTSVTYTSQPPAGGDTTTTTPTGGGTTGDTTPPPTGGGTTSDTTPPPAGGGTTGDTTQTPPPASGCRVFDTTTGQSSNAAVSPYSGPVAGLTSQFIDVTGDSLAVTATVPNVFIHTGSGEDAIDVSGVNGNNVLDGGTGSNFLVGGSGKDTFFVDDRSPAANIWSTVANFHSSDDVTIWGVNRSDFSLSWLDGQGAAGATGLTGIFTRSGQPDALMTLGGYTSADLTDGKLTLTYGQTADQPGLPGSSFLLIHAN